MSRIKDVRALEILDSRGRPTVSVTVRLESGFEATAQVPSGASTGKHEAVELRDKDPGRYGGEGVLRACAAVEEIIGPAIAGMDVTDQGGVDARTIRLDGTPDKSRLGANAILGVSCAVARAAALTKGVALWESLEHPNPPRLPVPMVNILSGGAHAGHRLEMQDFLVVPHGFASYREALEAAVRIHRATHDVVSGRGIPLTGVADEGGWGPTLERNEQALELLIEGIERAGFEPGRQVSIAVDPAASQFHRNGVYELASEKRSLTRAQMIQLLGEWVGRFPIVSIEDPLDEDDAEGWAEATAALGGKVSIIGDDFFTTNPDRVRRGVAEKQANAVLVKMNQIGTLTETMEVVGLARDAGWRAVISARSGETEDSFLADLAVASGAGQIKIGSVTRSERLAKYNRLLQIERDSGLPWPADTAITDR